MATAAVRRAAVACRWIDGVSGATTYILEKTRRFAAAGWEIHLYGERLDLDRIQEAGGIPHRILGWPWGSILKRRIFAWSFERAVRGIPFDLIEGHGDILAQDVLMLHNCVHAAHEAVHGEPLPASSGVGRIHDRILRENRFRLLIANSDLMKQEIVRRFGVPTAKIETVYPGFDLRRFNAEDREALGGPMRHGLGVGKAEILIGLVTSGDFQKRGVDIFIRSLARLNPEVRGRVHGVVVGKENRLEDYRRLAREAGLGPKMHFVPATTHVERCYHALDIFFYPARYEEFGLSVQEAMACGAPVLTSRRVGASELLGEAGCPMLLDNPDEEAFCARLEELIAQPEMRRRWAQAGIIAVKDNTWDRNFQRIHGLYEALIGPKGTA